MNESVDIEITVGLVTYNRPEYLKQAVRSVLQQTFKNFKLIISNDYQDVAVTFDSLGIKNDSRIKIINQERNLGEIDNMNYLLGIARGEWFVWLADDDLLHPEFLRLAYEMIIANSESNVVGVFSNYGVARSPVGLFPTAIKSNSGNCLCYGPSEFLMDYTSRKNRLIGCYGVMHIDVLRKIGGIPQLGNSFGPYGDTLIPILLAEHGRLCWLDEPLVFLTVHANSLSCKSTDFLAYTSAEYELLASLKRVCASKTVNVPPNKIIANMIKWFTINEWIVLSREPSFSVYEVCRIFVKHQLTVNVPMLSMTHRIHHLLFVLWFLGMCSVEWASKRFRAALAMK